MDRHHRRTHLHHQRLKRAPQATVTEVHYLTLKPTFSGPVAGYSTVNPNQVKTPTVKTTSLPSKPQTTKLPEPTTQEAKTTNTPTLIRQPTTLSKAVTTSPRPTKSSSVIEEETKTEAETETETIEVKTATSKEIETTSFAQTISSSLAPHTADSALETSTSTPTSIASKDGSGSGGASIGGIIGGCFAAVFILLLVAAVLYRKRKQRAMNEAYGKTEDEKAAGLGGGAAVAVGGPSSTNEKAPRVSLRPVTQFNPALNPPAASPIVKTGPSAGPGDHSIPRKPIPAPLALSKPPQSDMQPSTSNSVSLPQAPVMPAAQPSPTLSAFSDGFIPGTPVQGPVDASALMAAGKPAPVYRVQMDYIPSQPDELEIRVGALVRMLHEYDDGWALCIRMDRSQQGVCPRTCLSPRPVKPRPSPAPGSPANQPAPGSPANQQRRGPPPAHGHPPQGLISQNPQARPQSPANSQRYAPYSGSRPGTPSQQQRPQTPRTPQHPVPQITVTPTESDFSEKQPETEITPSREAPTSADAPTFHAM